MSSSTTQLFELLNSRHFSKESHEIECAVFGSFRRSIRGIWAMLCEVESSEGEEIKGKYRSLLSEFLTVPLPFDGSVLTAVQIMGSPASVSARYGSDMRRLYDEALAAASNLGAVVSPMRVELKRVIEETAILDQALRIFCHRSAISHFESLYGPDEASPLTAATFIHSARDYQDAGAFDVLIKIGPLRSRGWGWVPDAILTAPYFETLCQIVWSGCGDEPGFGYDPIEPTVSEGTDVPVASRSNVLGISNRISWNRTHFRYEDRNPPVGLASTPEEVDELSLFSKAEPITESRKAIFVQIEGGQGILFPPYSNILSFDTTSTELESISYRLPIETLAEGMFIVISDYDEVDFGENAQKGVFSEVWKERLKAAYERDPDGLVSALKLAGINLLYLGASIERWAYWGNGILPAPGYPAHFKILIKTLGVDWEGADVPLEFRGKDWTQCAWSEIRRARGVAIQAGRSENEIIDEQLLEILQSMRAEIAEQAQASGTFLAAIPPGKGIQGDFRFLKVLSIEQGFVVPESELFRIVELNMIDQWRV